ncbi:hypothetical protein C0995_016146 [Termitomyces sp. Mi166|nr:hypothetical protein C0995_016146 [Termitomyces sp. Mi166\
MNSVYFPAHVVLVLRRIVNVLSSLSISNQYILLKQAQADEERAKLQPTNPKASSLAPSLLDLQGQEWPNLTSLKSWDWRRTLNLAASSVNGSPSIGTRWSWPALLSTFTQTDLPTARDPPPPLKPQKNDKRSDAQTRLPELTRAPAPPDTIHQLMQNPALYDPLRVPRYPIVLCHGLYGFDSRGPLKFPSMRMHYWSNVLNVLRDTLKAEVIVTSVPGTGSIASRAEILDRQLQHKARGRGINFLAHSMGGLDCRHLITHIKPEVYAPLSLTSISTPHRGSPFMDWCADYIGIGKLREHERGPAKATDNVPPPTLGESTTKTRDAPFSLSLSGLPSSFTSLLLSIVDSPAYANLTTNYLNEVFNPRTPDDPTVKYFSVAGRVDSVNIWHPFWFTKLVLDGSEEKHQNKLRVLWEQEPKPVSTPPWAQEREWGNDGLVTVQSARWGEFLGIMEGCDRKIRANVRMPDWEMRGARGIEFGVDLPAIPAIGLGISTLGHRADSGDGWTLLDFGRFVGAWKKEQKIQADVAATMESVGREEQRKLEREKDDAIVKSSTDRLSAVVDWLTEQMPSPSLIGGKSKTSTEPVERVKGPSRSAVHPRMKNELASKKDLERFYVALSRKLYDEGL